jgi:AraC-like DNA-binding protein
MLVVRGERRLGGGAFRSRLVVGDELLVHVVERSGLRLDTRFHPPIAEPAREVDLLWLVLAGRATIRSRDAQVESELEVVGPAAVFMSEADFVGAAGLHRYRVADTGEPFRVVEVRFRRAHRAASVEGEGPRLLVLDRTIWALCEKQFDNLELRDDDAVRAGVAALLASLETLGIVKPTLLGSVGPQPTEVRMLWGLMASAYEALDAGTTFKTLGAGLLSTKRVERLVSRSFGRLLLPAGSWRSTIRGMRLGLAALFLSEPSTTIKRVAEAIGYANAEALANALQHAGLPAPTTIRAEHLRELETTRSQPRTDVGLGGAHE